MEPCLEVVVVPDGSPELGSEEKLGGEWGSPPKKRLCCSPSLIVEPMDWELLKPAVWAPPTRTAPMPCSTPRSLCPVPPDDWVTDCLDPALEWPKERAGSRELPKKFRPALAHMESPAPCTSLSQPARPSDPMSSGSCRPTKGDLACQQLKKPAQSKRPKPMGNEGAAAMALLVRGILSAFTSGLRLTKLLAIMRTQHGVTVEVLGGAAGTSDILRFLAQVPGLQVHTPERGLQCLIQLEKELVNKPAPAPGPSPSPAPRSSLSQPAQRSHPVSSCCCCCPTKGGQVLQQPKKPVQLKRSKSMGNGELVNKPAPAPRPSPSPAPRSSLSQPAQRSDPVSSCCCCCPAKGGQVLQQPKKPVQLKRSKSMGNGGAACSLAPLLQQVLRPFPQGLGLSKLLKTLWQDHGLDLVALSWEAGDGDILGLLGQMPGIQLHKSSGRSECTVRLSTAVKPSSC